MKIKLEKDWQYPVYCLNCKEVLWSDYEGQYVACTCGGAFCDQTAHYSRCGGEHIMVPRSPLEGKDETI